MQRFLKFSEPKYFYGAFYLLIAIIFFYRLFFLPGASFNTQLWDDELQWRVDRESKSVIDWILYRDAPGYFVVFPRIIFLLAENIPILNFEVRLRIILIFIQIVCLFFASKLNRNTNNRPIEFIAFFALLSVWIEDLNYLHNIGYLFLFPLLYIILSKRKLSLSFQGLKLIIVLILIAKPITALILVTIIFGSILTNFIKKRYKFNLFEFLTIIYCVLYLISYFILPKRWDTPFNSDVSSIFPAIVNISWIIGAALIPYIYIVLPGIFNLMNAQTLLPYVGIILYIMPTLLFLKYYRTIALWFKGSLLNNYYLYVSLAVTYASTYSLSTISWITHFPLWDGNSPNLLWGRWSAIVYYTILLILSALNIKTKTKLIFLVMIIFQNFTLQIFGAEYLRRWW